jgi:hypothetical protein
LITTIIPTYCRPQLLRRAIRSVLGQTYPNVLACVYDNASGEETTSVVKKLQILDDRIRYHCHPENIGAGANFEYGLTRVATPFFSILSDDDFLLPHFYARAMEAFARHPEAGFCSLGVMHLDSWGCLRREGAMAGCRPGLYTVPEGFLAMLARRPPTWTGIVFRKEIITGVAPLDLMIGSAGDIDYVLRVAARYPYVLVQEAGAVFNAPSIAKNTMVRGALDYFWPGALRIAEKILADEGLAADLRHQVETSLDEWWRQDLRAIAVASALRGDFSGAYRASAVLAEHYHRVGRARWLYGLAWLCERMPGVRRLMALTLDVRGIARRYWNDLRSLWRPDERQARRAWRELERV